MEPAGSHCAAVAIIFLLNIPAKRSVWFAVQFYFSFKAVPLVSQTDIPAPNTKSVLALGCQLLRRSWLWAPRGKDMGTGLISSPGAARGEELCSPRLKLQRLLYKARAVPTCQAFGHLCDPHCIVWCCSRAAHLCQAPFTSARRHFVTPAAILHSREAAPALSCYPPMPLGGRGEEVSVVLMAQLCSLAPCNPPGCLHAAGLGQAASCSHCGVSASFPALHHRGLCSMSSWHLLGTQGPRLHTPRREAAG